MLNIQSVSTAVNRMTLLIWGDAGCGKTTLAATMPGKKLFLNFDPDGTTSIASFDDVNLADLSTEAANTEQYIARDPWNISTILKGEDYEETGKLAYDTLVVDSMTNATEMVLNSAIGGTNNSTQRKPAMASYQWRNRYTLSLVKTLLAVTKKLGVHCVLICHEAPPQTNSDNAVIGYGILLGGALAKQAPLDVSEVWAVTDPGKGQNRKIAIRPCRMRAPMKTRMFATSGEPEFEWAFDPEDQSGMTIAGWWEAYQAGGFAKLPLPKKGG